MPRLNSKKTSSKKICTTSYDHNENYESCTNEYSYTKKDNLVLWTEFCDKIEPVSIDGPSGNYRKIARDRSADAESLSIYAPDAAVEGRVFKESTLAYVVSLLPDSLQEHVTPNSLDMCGDPCFWFNFSLGTPRVGDDTNCLSSNYGVDNLLIQNNAAINFANAGATQDTPFTISMWYYPIDYVGNSNALYNRGGENRILSPVLFEKAYQYGLYIRECGKLEFVLYDTDITVSEPSSRQYNFSGSSTTLTVRSSNSVLKPAQWNHICVTYDGSGTRAGMKIYVNCVDVVNPGDVPSVAGVKTASASNVAIGTLQSTFSTFTLSMFKNAGFDSENPSNYTAMHTYNTPLLFGNQALVTVANSFIGSGINPASMTLNPASALPWSFIFDIAIWNTNLSIEDVAAVCDATKTCVAGYTSVFGRDSGYINLSPRIMKDILDQKNNSLSVIDRVGDRSNRKKISREPFDDNKTIFYGKKLIDEFDAKHFSFKEKNISYLDREFGIPKKGVTPDEKVWKSFNAKIRREHRRGFNRLTSLSLSSPGLSKIQTVEKFNNATIYYDLIIGPHNRHSSPSFVNKGGMIDLKAIPKGGANLFIDINTGNPNVESDWSNVKQHKVDFNTSPNEFFSPNAANGQILSPEQHLYRRSFVLHFRDINSKGLPYYIRFRTTDRCWGIGRIEIQSFDEQLRYPVLVNHDTTYGKHIDENFIATPHTRSDIVTTARSISGITDTMSVFTDNKTQKVTPFSDTKLVPFSNNEFFDAGVDADIFPGFSNPLKDKTCFTLELSSSSEIDIGFTTKGTVNEIGGAGNAYNHTGIIPQPIACAWDNAQGKWRHFDQGKVTPVTFPDHAYMVNVRNMIPFTPIDVISSASVDDAGVPDDKNVQFGPEILSSYAQPNASFGFPSAGGTFLDVNPEGPNSTGVNQDALIKMSDYITKPFLLEKVVVEFNARFEFAGNSSKSSGGPRRGHRLLYATASHGGTKPSERSVDNNVVLIPSFYLLNVKRNSSKLYSRNYIFDDVNTFARTGSLDSTATYVDTNAYRENFVSSELITYGQMTLFLSGTGQSKIDIEKALEDGLARDAVYDIRDLNGQSGDGWLSSGIDPITSSFKMEFPVRNAPRTEYGSRLYMKTMGNNYFNILVGNKAGGRSTMTDAFGYQGDFGFRGAQINLPEGGTGQMPNASQRGLFNSFAAIDQKNVVEYLTPKGKLTGGTEEPFPVKSSGFLLENEDTSTSPYLLMPKDTLSLNFAYPVPTRYVYLIPGSTDTLFNKMTIFGTTKVHLYGSCVKNGKEFHENMNQALTTPEITEPIGSEAVVDQFIIEPRDEYYKTYVDRTPFSVWQPGNLIGNRNWGSLTTPEFLFDFKDRKSGYGVHEVFGISGGSQDGMSPAIRIGLKNGSRVNVWDSYQKASASLDEQPGGSDSPHGFTKPFTDPTYQPILGSLLGKAKSYEKKADAQTRHVYRKSFVFPFVEVYNNGRRYHDEGQLEILSASIFPPTTAPAGQSAVKLGKNQQNVSREKYIFSHKHFGYRSDILDTAKDSKFKRLDERGRPINPSDPSERLAFFSQYNSSPVKVSFATASINLKDQGTVDYYDITGSSTDDVHNKTVNSVITGPFDDSSASVATLPIFNNLFFNV